MIKVLDNAIPEIYQNYILNYITGVEKLQSSIPTDKYYPLEFCGNLSTGIPPFRKNEMGFGKTFFKENTLNEHSSALLFPLYHILGSKNILPKKIIEGRVFMQLPNGNKSHIQSPHLDKHIPHHSLLYYVCGTDGNTVFYDKGLSINDYNTENQDAINDLKENHIKKIISPKKGRAVFFTGDIWHSGSTPTKEIRIVLNYNFTI